MEIGNPVIIGINTVFLYVFAAALVGLIAFLMIRNHMRKRKIAARGGDGAFEGMPRTDKQIELKLLQQQNLFLREMYTWLDTRLLESAKAQSVRVTLMQDWCLEDLDGTSDAPAQCRPKDLIFTSDGKTTVYHITGYQPEQTFSSDQIKLLNWGIMERCRTLIPFRVYRMRVHRTTRTFRVENNVPVCWKTDMVTKEDYTVEIE